MVFKKGYKQSKEHIKKRLDSRKNNGKPWHSEEWKRKLSKARKGKNCFKFKTNLFNDFSIVNMWLLGLFASDGCMNLEKRGGHKINFSGKYKDMLKVRKHLNQGKIFSVGNYSSLYFRDIRIFKRLLKLGMTPRKSKTLIYPKIPQQYNLDRNFIRGFFEGDGWVSLGSKITKDYRVGFCSGSKVFIEELKRRLSVYGIKGSNIYLQKSNWGKCYKLEFSTGASKLIYDFIYKDVGKNLICESKYIKFQKLIKNHKNNVGGTTNIYMRNCNGRL